MLARNIADDRIQAEHVATVFRVVPIAVLTQVLDAAVVAALLWFLTDSPHATLSIWYAAVVVLGALRFQAMRLYDRARPAPSQWRRWAAIAAGFAAAYGVVWAVAIALFLDFDAPVSVILLVVLPLGLAAGAAATHAALPVVFFAFVLVVEPVLMIVLFASGTAMGYAIGAMVLFTLVGHSIVCLNTRQVLDRSLRLQFELKARETALQQAREHAERANSAKTRFLAAASHDLRQPMHALGLFFSALTRKVNGKETEVLIAHIEETIGVISNMLNALLDISKLDAGVVQPKVGPVSVSDLIQLLRTELSPSARERGNILVFRGCEATVKSDSAMLERILRNLIANALRYTHGGRVLVACRRRGAELRFEVHDTGIGIPADRLDDIFLEFHQLGNPQRDRGQGLGLGLAIVKRLTDLLGHHIEVHSVVGRGSCFAVSVPLLPEGRAVSTVGEHPRLDDLVRAPQRRRVLVLDDDKVVQQAMRELLTGWGYSVDVVGTPQEAPDRAAKHQPDLLVVDYRLAGKASGADAIEALYSLCGQQIPAVVITGDTAPDRLREAMSRGYPLLHKPLQPAKLRTVLAYLGDRGLSTTLSANTH